MKNKIEVSPQEENFPDKATGNVPAADSAFIDKVIQEVIKEGSFLEGKQYEAIISDTPSVAKHYKISNYKYYTRANEPFIGDCARVPQTPFVVSSGPRSEEEFITLLHDTILDSSKMKLKTPAEKIKISQVVSIIDRVSEAPINGKDAYDYFAIERLIKHEDYTIKIKQKSGKVVIKDCFEIKDEVIPVKYYAGENYEAQYPQVQIAQPVTPFVSSEVIVKKRLKQEVETLSVDVINVADTLSIDLDMKTYDDDAGIQKKKKLSPKAKEALLERLWQLYVKSQNEFILVHCKAGVGRTGHFILMMEILKNNKEIFAAMDVSKSAKIIHELIEKIRIARPALISNQEQAVKAISNAYQLYTYALKKGYNLSKNESSPLFPAYDPNTLSNQKNTVAQPASIEKELATKLTNMQATSIKKELDPKLTNSNFHAEIENNERYESFIKAMRLGDHAKESAMVSEIKQLTSILYNSCVPYLVFPDSIWLKQAIENCNEYLYNILPFKNNRTIIELSNEDLQFLSNDIGRIKKHEKSGTIVNTAIPNAASWLVAKYIGTSLLDWLSQDCNIEEVRYQKLLKFLIKNNCLSLVNYFLLANDPSVEETKIWLTTHGLDPNFEADAISEETVDKPQAIFSNNAPKVRPDYLFDNKLDSWLQEQMKFSLLKLMDFNSLAMTMSKTQSETLAILEGVEDCNRSELKNIIHDKNLYQLVGYFPELGPVVQLLDLSYDEREELRTLQDKINSTVHLMDIYWSIRLSGAYQHLIIDNGLKTLEKYLPKDVPAEKTELVPDNQQAPLSPSAEELEEKTKNVQRRAFLALGGEIIDLLYKIGDIAGINNAQETYLAILNNNPVLADLISYSEEFSPLQNLLPVVIANLPQQIEHANLVDAGGYSASEMEMIVNFANEVDCSWEVVEKGLKARDEFFCQSAEALGFEALLGIVKAASITDSQPIDKAPNELVIPPVSVEEDKPAPAVIVEEDKPIPALIKTDLPLVVQQGIFSPKYTPEPTSEMMYDDSADDLYSDFDNGEYLNDDVVQDGLDKNLSELQDYLGMDFQEMLDSLEKGDAVILAVAEELGFSSILNYYPPVNEDENCSTNPNFS